MMNACDERLFEVRDSKVLIFKVDAKDKCQLHFHSSGVSQPESSSLVVRPGELIWVPGADDGIKS